MVLMVLALTVPITPVLANDDADRSVEEILREILDLLQQQPPPQQPPIPTDPPPTTTPAPDSPNPRLTTPQNVTVNAGQTIEVTLTLRNIGMGAASNILSQALPSSGAPFTVEFINNTNSINNLAANATRNMTLRITVNANAAGGSHQINLTHLFRTPSGTNTSTTDIINVRIVADDEGVPNINLSNFRTGTGSGLMLPGSTAPIGPGQNFTLSADISNLGNVDARNVQISLPNLSADTIFFTGDLNQFFFSNMATGHTSTLSFPLRTSQNITSGTHQIDFRVTYRGESGDPIVETFPAFVTVYAQDEVETQANFEIRNMTTTTGNLRVGQTGTVSFYVHNTGDAEARNLRVVANPGSHIRPTAGSAQTIASLAPGASHRLTFSFSPRESAETGSHDIGFTVGTGDSSIEQFTFLNVFNPEREDDTAPGRVQIPRVIVAALELYPITPRAGQEFTMEVTFRNTSATRSVNNIRILIEEMLTTIIPGQQSHFAGFNPVGGSNALFVDFLAPLGEVTKTLRFTTVTEATPGAHNMRFRFDYQDQDFYTRDAEQQISISIAQLTRLELADINVGGWVTPAVGMAVPFSYNIINSGRVNLINVRTRTEGPFDVTQGGRYIGQLNSQRMAGFDGAIIPFYPGEQSGVFIIYGEDVTGEMVEIRHEFTVFVEGGRDEGGFGEDWREGGGMGGDFGMVRPGDGMGMGDIGMMGGEAWCHVAGEMVQTGYLSDTGEWVSLGEWCMETGAWLPARSGFDFMGLIQRPVVWGSAIAVGVIGAVVVIVIVRRKRPQFDVNLDD